MGPQSGMHLIDVDGSLFLIVELRTTNVNIFPERDLSHSEACKTAGHLIWSSIPQTATIILFSSLSMSIRARVNCSTVSINSPCECCHPLRTCPPPPLSLSSFPTSSSMGLQIALMARCCPHHLHSPLPQKRQGILAHPAQRAQPYVRCHTSQH